MKAKLKKIIKAIDARFLGGKIIILYFNLRNNKKKAFFGKRKAVIVTEPVVDMVLMQYNQSDYMQYQFYDLAVRYLAIDEYYGNNTIGFDLYKKMHTLGGNYGQNNQTEEYYKARRKRKKVAKYGIVKEEHSIEQFQQLIKSYDDNGYDASSVIMADKNMLSMNGSHRISLAVYREQELMNVEIHNLLFKRRFSYDWFWQVGFSRQELDIIDTTMKNILEDCKKKLGEFYFILYPPAYNYFDEIVRDIDQFDVGNIVVTEYDDYLLQKEDFIGFIRAVYAFDSILPRNFERKLYYILQASTYIDGKLPMRLVRARISNPMYRLKSDNGLPESINTVRLKEAIRCRYKIREEKFTKHYVGDYAHDVIIHSTDNYLSNKAVRLLTDIDRDITELFVRLKSYNYCILETSLDKLSQDFPKSFYLNEDIDIFVKADDLEKVSREIALYCEEKYNSEWLSVENIVSDNGRRVRVLLKECLIIMFDLMVKLPELKPSYIDIALQNSIEKDFKHLSADDEIIVRLCKYVSSPQKTWHADYIKKCGKHRQELNYDAFVNEKKVKKVYDSIFN